MCGVRGVEIDACNEMLFMLFSARPHTADVVSAATAIFDDFQAHQHTSNRNSDANIYRFGAAIAICAHIVIDIAKDVSEWVGSRRNRLTEHKKSVKCRDMNGTQMSIQQMYLDASQAAVSMSILLNFQMPMQLNAVRIFQTHTHTHIRACFSISVKYAYMQQQQFVSGSVRQILKVYELN